MVVMQNFIFSFELQLRTRNCDLPSMVDRGGFLRSHLNRKNLGDSGHPNLLLAYLISSPRRNTNHWKWSLFMPLRFRRHRNFTQILLVLINQKRMCTHTQHTHNYKYTTQISSPIKKLFFPPLIFRFLPFFPTLTVYFSSSSGSQRTREKKMMLRPCCAF